MDSRLPEDPALSVELPEREELVCRRYSRARTLLAAAELLLPLGLLAGLTLSGAAGALLRFSRALAGASWTGSVLFLVLLGLLTAAVSFPAQFAGQHWLDRRYGLARQRAWSWCCEWICCTAVWGLALLVMLLPAVLAPPAWRVWASLPWCGFLFLCRPLFLDYCYYPLLSRFYPVRFLRTETFILPGIGRITLPVYQVRVSHKTRRVNAAIRLRGPKTAIYVTDTLIEAFTDGEERVVMAHEFGHLYDRLHLEERTRAGVAQAQRKLALGSSPLLAALLSVALIHCAAPALQLRGVHDLAALPLLVALTLGLAHAIAPLLCAEARRDEEDADRYALAVTGDVRNYVSVMRKLRRMNLEALAADPWSRLLFDTHPSYAERLDLALQHRCRPPRRRKPRHWRGWRHIQNHGRR